MKKHKSSTSTLYTRAQIPSPSTIKLSKEHFKLELQVIDPKLIKVTFSYNFLGQRISTSMVYHTKICLICTCTVYKDISWKQGLDNFFFLWVLQQGRGRGVSNHRYRTSQRISLPLDHHSNPTPQCNKIKKGSHLVKSHSQILKPLIVDTLSLSHRKSMSTHQVISSMPIQTKAMREGQSTTHLNLSITLLNFKTYI